MKAIRIAQSGAPDVLQIVDTPTPTPGAGEVLVKVVAAGVNFADLMAREGKYPLAPKPPFVPGSEVAGVVESVGPGVVAVKPGAYVFGLSNFGGYAEYAILHVERAVPMPDGLEPGVATALLVQGLTAYFLLEDAPLRAGESVLVNAAAGGVGSLAVQIARLKGAGTVIGTASTDDKRRLIRDLGADAAVDYMQSGWGQAVREVTGGKGVDVFLDATGEMASEGYDTLADGGRWLIYGTQSGGFADLPGARLSGLQFRGQSIAGYTLYRPVTTDPAKIRRTLSELIGWTLSGALKVTATDRFPLADAKAAHEAIATRKTSGKVVLEPWPFSRRDSRSAEVTFAHN